MGCHPDRKRILLLFLYASGLIDRRKPVIDLRGADLSGTSLSGADLSGAKLRETDLREANLTGARGIEDGQLEQAFSLEGATMPDGTKPT